MSRWSCLAGVQLEPLLTPTEELLLGKQVQAWLSEPAPCPYAIERRGRRARDRMIRANLGLVLKLVSRYVPRTKGTVMSEEDLFQEGCIGLTRACEKFEPEKGYRFSTYSYWWIRQAMGRAAEEACTTIRVPSQSRAVERRWKYRPEDQSLADFCAAHNYDPKWASDVLRMCDQSRSTSLDARFSPEGDTPLGELLPDPSSTPRLDEIDHNFAIAQMCAEFPDEMALIDLGLTFKRSEIAELQGVSRQQASAQVKDAIEKVSTAFAHHRTLVAV